MRSLSVAEAQAAIQANVQPVASTPRGLRELVGTVLAQSIAMERDQPPFDRVTMDGIAIYVGAGSTTADRTFRIAGTQAAGAAPLQLQHPSDCIEVMTGAALPGGCDCIIPVERLQRTADQVTIEASINLVSGLNVHRKGSDARRDVTLLQPGVRIEAKEVAVIASAGYAQVAVRSSPRIALVSTGDELIEPGQPIEDWQIRRSNTYALHAALQRRGHAQLVDVHLLDDPAQLRAALTNLLDNNDVLILSGGVSMGKFDFVPQVLTELGVRCVFHKIEQRPGKPMWFGVRDDGKSVYALPGNPASTFICLHRYVLPGLQLAMGASWPAPESISLGTAINGHEQLSVFMPIKLITDAHGITRAEPKPTRGSGDFISLLDSDGFVELPPTKGMIQAGAVVPLTRW